VTVTDTFTVDIVANDPDTNTVALNLTGGSGDDVIAGGFGNDIFTGGAGDDIFQWTLGDQGTGGSPAVDIVVDFGNGTDKLDLKDLLQGEGAGNLTDYLHFTYNGITNSTTVNVSTHGDGVVDQQIVLAAVDITDAGALNDATIITNLLNQGKLVVDS
jgi:Ca2+-binding RTX toxin-like protein